MKSKDAIKKSVDILNKFFQQEFNQPLAPEALHHWAEATLNKRMQKYVENRLGDFSDGEIVLLYNILTEQAEEKQKSIQQLKEEFADENDKTPEEDPKPKAKAKAKSKAKAKKKPKKD